MEFTGPTCQHNLAEKYNGPGISNTDPLHSTEISEAMLSLYHLKIWPIKQYEKSVWHIALYTLLYHGYFLNYVMHVISFLRPF